ncbi:hypothetical protein PybrP1_010137 [[Pythium] brassicae (nom. inval.)]|nr:hypothetical protein PybrP1_010137 [[Pythium] brassicae (nom. inval.)]
MPRGQDSTYGYGGYHRRRDSHDGDNDESGSEPEMREDESYTAAVVAAAAAASDAASLADRSRKWTDSEETALIEFWRENAAQYTTKTKRFFYDSAARVPALRRKNVAQIKSKCFDIEKRYRETTKLLLNPAYPEATGRRWVLKKFSLYYDVQPLLEQGAPADAEVETPLDSPPPAGVPSFTVSSRSGKKRLLTGGAPPPSPKPAPYVPSKRQRAEIERRARANDLAIAVTTASTSTSMSTSTSTSASAGAASEAVAVDVGAETRAVATSPALTSVSVFASPVRSSVSASGAGLAPEPEPAPASPFVSPQTPENKELMEAAAQKMRAEARIATIRAHAVLLRERKALLEEGVSVSEIDALLPLQSLI